MTILRKVIDLTTEVPLSKRDDWKHYFMSLCYMVSLRSTCGSRRVGAVLVDGLEPGKRRVIATGYNGNPPNSRHCIDGGCPRFEAKKKGLLDSGNYTDEYPCDAFHAEHNAMIQVMKSNLSTKNAVMFTTTFPCLSCARKMNGAQIKVVYYCEGYPDSNSTAYLKRYGIKAIKLEQTDLLKGIMNLSDQISIGTRDTWDEYFMALAYMASLRSKSDEERNGAVLIKDKRIVATGYNGYPVTDFPDDIEEKEHPEDMFTAAENVLNQIKITNISSSETELYTTLYPTFNIAGEINGADIKKVYYCEGEVNEATKSYFERYKIKVEKIKV